MWQKVLEGLLHCSSTPSGAGHEDLVGRGQRSTTRTSAAGTGEERLPAQLLPSVLWAVEDMGSPGVVNKAAATASDPQVAQAQAQRRPGQARQLQVRGGLSRAAASVAAPWRLRLAWVQLAPRVVPRRGPLHSSSSRSRSSHGSAGAWRHLHSQQHSPPQQQAGGSPRCRPGSSSTFGCTEPMQLPLPRRLAQQGLAPQPALLQPAWLSAWLELSAGCLQELGPAQALLLGRAVLRLPQHLQGIAAAVHAPKSSDSSSGGGNSIATSAGAGCRGTAGQSGARLLPLLVHRCEGVDAVWVVKVGWIVVECIWVRRWITGPGISCHLLWDESGGAPWHAGGSMPRQVSAAGVRRHVQLGRSPSRACLSASSATSSPLEQLCQLHS